MRYIYLLLSSLILCTSADSQESAWTKKTVNDILTVDLPKEHKFEKQDIIKSFIGTIGEEYFSVSYYDTTMKVSNAEEFRISLTGFAHGLTRRVPQNEYQISLNDTAIGNTKGIFIRFTANSNADYLKDMVCYATMANNHFYSFTSTVPADPKVVNLKTHFFKKIHFEAEKIKETRYQLNAILVK